MGIGKAEVDLFSPVPELKCGGRSFKIQACPLGDADFFGDLTQVKAGERGLCDV